ncbi:hypothetical protein [Rufibacter sp. LB8]|uniref:hypothetical protein n=1 Tax=Rufibacter sp. LB8 TaxID=2777781 RepID=UPI00178C39EF|nr:hypothetical protein [Rufibacter sp. LB8]
MKEEYTIARICSNGHTQRIAVSKREVAFELVDINEVLGPQCGICHSITFSTSHEIPEIDLELLQEWSTNLDLYFMPQDEELLLADEKYLDMILEMLDSVQLPDHKRNVLMDALCVIVYDNTIEGNDKKDDQLKSRVISELVKRKEKLVLAEEWIMDYIKDVVYPQLEEK